MTQTTEITNPAPRLVLDQSFSDIESIARVMGWDQEFRRLEPGRLDASLLVVGNPFCRAVRIAFNRGFHQRGKPPSQAFAFGLPDPEFTRLKWEGADLPAGALVNFNTPAGLDMTNKGSFSGSILVFDAEPFRQHVEQYEPNSDILEEIGSEPFWIPVSRQLDELRALLAAIFKAATDTRDETALIEYRDSFEFELAAGIIRVIDGARSPTLPPLPARRKVLKRALAFLESSGDEIVTVSALCRAVGTSCSTLERAFQDEFGVNPKTYMRTRRLTRVHTKLIQPETEGSISEIAQLWGFWHMSAFSADYRNEFGELPSETRARSTHQ